VGAGAIFRVGAAESAASDDFAIRRSGNAIDPYSNKSAHNTGWITNRQTISRDVFSHHTTRANNGVVSDKNAGKDGAGPVTRTIVPDPMAEYRFEPADEGLLKAIAATTGGAWRPAPSALVTAPGDRTTERRPMWPPLLALALALWLLDVLFRRIRVFEARGARREVGGGRREAGGAFKEAM